jgi:lipopolysaccharide/colanic/teichoic acid biosynthesis glycosyltransferase
MSVNLYQRWGKRLFDLALTLPIMIISAPLMAIIAFIVRLELGSPVLFSQQRPGLNSKPFNIYKFRSMTDDRDPNGMLLPDPERLTPFGKFLRITSLDELPGLLNVIKGDMSMVGPRPLLMKYLPYYTENEKIRHSVRPGLTGLAQVSGGTELPWNQSLELDVKYVQRMSLWLDLLIIVKTIPSILKRKDVGPTGTRYPPLHIERSLERETGDIRITGGHDD